MNLFNVRNLWNRYRNYLLNTDESFNGYSLLDRVYYISRNILQGINVYCYKLNPLMLQEIKVTIKRDAIKNLYIFDSIGTDIISDEMSHITVNCSEMVNLDNEEEKKYVAKYPLFMRSEDHMMVEVEETTIEECSSKQASISIIESESRSIDYPDNHFYYTSNLFDIDADFDNNYSEDYVTMTSFLLEASCGVIIMCKIIEAAMLDVERDIHKNNLEYDYNGSDGEDNPLFSYVEKYLTQSKFINILSDKKNIKNSKHLNWLDEAKNHMGIHILSNDELIERTADMFIDRLEGVSITSNGNSQNNLIVPDEIRNDIKTLLATKDNYGNPYDLVVSCVAEPNDDANGLSSSFPTVLVFHDNKIDTLEMIDDNMLKLSANNIKEWLNEELEARNIDRGLIDYGEDLMERLKFDDNGIIVSADDSPVDTVDVTKLDSEEAINTLTKLSSKFKENNEEPEVTEDSNVIEDKASEKLTPFTLSCKIAESMDNKFMDLMITQMNLSLKDLKDISDTLGKVTELSYNEYYSDKYCTNDVSFQDIFNQDNMVLNIVANGQVMDSILFYYDGDRDGWDCTRIYDKIHTAVNGFSSAFARACKFSRNSKLSLNFCTYAGFYNADLTKAMDIIGVPTENGICDEDMEFIRFDVSMYALNVIRSAFLLRYVKTKRSGGKHFIKDLYNFRKVIGVYDFNKLLNSLEELMKEKELTKSDITDIKSLIDKSIDDIESYKDTKYIDGGTKGIHIMFFNGLVGQAVDGTIIIGKDNRISRPELFKKGISFCIMKDDKPLLAIEDLGKSNNYEFSKMFIQICKFLESDYYIMDEDCNSDDCNEEEAE